MTLSMASGGAERVISLIALFLMEVYNVKLILFYNSIQYDLPENLEVVSFTDKKLSFWRKIYLFPLFIYKYIALLRKEKVDISLSFLIRPNLVNGMARVFAPDTKVILSERCYPTITYQSSWVKYGMYKLLIPLFYNKADALFPNSVYINKDLVKNFSLKIPAHVIYNPVKQPDKYREITPVKQKPVKLICVSFMRKLKNHVMIVKALPYCKTPYEMTFLGDGSEMDALVSLSKKLQVDKYIHFPGRVKM